MRLEFKTDVFVTLVLDCAHAEQHSIKKFFLGLPEQDNTYCELVLLNYECGVIDFSPNKIRVLAVPQLQIKDLLNGSGLDLVQGDYLMFLIPGDLLAPGAISKMHRFISMHSYQKEVEIVIFDHVLQPSSLTRQLMSWDPDLIRYLDYISSGCLISTEIIKKLRVHRSQKIQSLHEFLKMYAESNRNRVVYLPYKLAEFQRPEPKPDKLEFEQRAIPPVSIIIPNKDHAELLSKCVEFLSGSDLDYQLIIVDNQSSEQKTYTLYEVLRNEFDALILPFNRPFNYSAMINLGVRKVKNEFVLLLNNDVKIPTASEVKKALSYIQSPQIGVVGSVLRYPNGTVQHAGILLRNRGKNDYDTQHVLRYSSNAEGEYIGALTSPRNWQSVTGAFQVVSKSTFDAVGGYDEVNLPIEFNDIDFCLKVRSIGLRVVCLPLEGVIHDESTTRSKIDQKKALKQSEEAYSVMVKRWASAYSVDHNYELPEQYEVVKGKTAGASHHKLTFQNRESLLSRMRNSLLCTIKNTKSEKDALPQTKLLMGVAVVLNDPSSRELIERASSVTKACQQEAVHSSRFVMKRSRRSILTHRLSSPKVSPNCIITVYVVNAKNIKETLESLHIEGRYSIAYVATTALPTTELHKCIASFQEIWILTSTDEQRKRFSIDDKIRIITPSDRDPEGLGTIARRIQDLLQEYAL